MQFFITHAAFRFVTVAALTCMSVRTAVAQDWCAVKSAKPYSKNMPGITLVSFGNINRSSLPLEGTENSSVSASDTTTLTAGKRYTLTIGHSRDSVAFPRVSNNLRVWIDLNRNGSFDDADELVLAADNVPPGQSIFSIVIPGTTRPIAATRMRVTAKMSQGGGHTPPTACDLPPDPFGYHGEIEDYTVTIAAMK